jgi:RNA polymerase sigma factor (sigma-70 family)
MQETSWNAQEMLKELAGRMIESYVRGLLAQDCLIARLVQAQKEQEEPDGHKLELLALTVCSQVLCEACVSSNHEQRNLGFENLQRYLETALARRSVRPDQRAEVVQQTLVEIWGTVQRRGTGPDQPAAFLKWASVILQRQLFRYFHQTRREDCVSLEEEAETLLELLIDPRDTDPIDSILSGEFQVELKKAILALRNPQYRQVLLSTFFAEIEERELAARLKVQVQDIYLWRYRALKALRKQMPERSLLVS